MADTTSDAAVHCTIVDGVATISLDAAEARNTLSRRLVGDLRTALDLATQPDTRVIVLTHSGTVFCAGADLAERSQGIIDTGPLVEVLDRLMHATQPTIAAVRGAVRAGGVGLMAACDLVVVDRRVDFAFTEVRIGVAPALISVPILRRCSAAHLMAPFLTGETFDAARAREIGLVSHLSDDVDATVRGLTESLREAAPNAIAATKAVLRHDPNAPTAAWLAEMRTLSDALFAGAEGAEGMRAFLDKRPPSWSPRAT